jgi:hypothetical protein
LWWELPKQAGMPVAPNWVEPFRYRFVVEAGCNMGPLMGKFAVNVLNGRVVGLRRLDPAGSAAGADVETLGKLLKRVRDTKKAGGESVIVQDSKDGHPIIVTFGMSEMDLDGALCFRISDYADTGIIM